MGSGQAEPGSGRHGLGQDRPSPGQSGMMGAQARKDGARAAPLRADLLSVRSRSSFEEPAKTLALLGGLGLLLRDQPRHLSPGILLQGGVHTDGGLQVLAPRLVLPNQGKGRRPPEQRLGTRGVHPAAAGGRRSEGACHLHDVGAALECLEAMQSQDG